jgi:hypothetical protein
MRAKEWCESSTRPSQAVRKDSMDLPGSDEFPAKMAPVRGLPKAVAWLKQGPISTLQLLHPDAIPIHEWPISM